MKNSEEIYNKINQKNLSSVITFADFQNSMKYAEKYPDRYNPHLPTKINKWIEYLRIDLKNKDMISAGYIRNDIINEGYSYILDILGMNDVI